MTNRKNTKPIHVGSIQIGGCDNVVIQSMTNTKTTDIDATVNQISRLMDAGCDLVRLAVPTMEAAEAFGVIREKCGVPLVADIHFNHSIALKCIEVGADKIRINPGNIGSEEGVKRVAQAAKAKNVPIRIGVNSGSMSKTAVEKYGNTAMAMVESAFEHIRMLNKYDFDDIAVSLKASDVVRTVDAYRLMSARCSYPLHIGVTEAGTLMGGRMKSAVGIGALLLDGIGDTIRVSLTADPVEEIYAAKEILSVTGLRSEGVEFVSCPSCGRCKIDLISVATEVESRLKNIDKNIKVAVMGCGVNGPGEAKDADVGIAGGDGCGLIFRRGEIIRKVSEDILVDELMKEIEQF